MTREFQERKTAPYPDLEPIEAEALRFTKSWHRYPSIHEAIWYKGVNLGEVDEYLLFPEVLITLMESEQGLRD